MTADPTESDTNLRTPLIRKLVVSGLGLVLLVTSALTFHRHRNLAETVVLSPGVTDVKRLSSYFDGIEGTVNDCNLYFFDGEETGATILVVGGTHPEEPAGRLAAWLFAENAVMEQGRLIIALSEAPEVRLKLVIVD